MPAKISKRKKVQKKKGNLRNMAAVVYFTFKFYSFLRFFSVLCTTIMTAMMSFSWVWLHKRSCRNVCFLWKQHPIPSTSYFLLKMAIQHLFADIYSVTKKIYWLRQQTTTCSFIAFLSFFCRFPWVFPSIQKDYTFCKEKKEETLEEKKTR